MGLCSCLAKLEAALNAYSQAGQDRYVYGKLPKPNGTFIDIGCGHPKNINNTLALEEMGWRGVLVDATEHPEIKSRASQFVKGDATTMNWESILRAFPGTIDYLSLDVDAASFDALKNLMKHKPKFRIITIEHDHYQRGEALRVPQRNLLHSLGYVLEQPDVKSEGCIFEDWWIHPEHIKDGLPANGEVAVINPSCLNDYFGTVFCINMARRTDRWNHAMRECDNHNLKLERFEGIDLGHLGNHGCTQSHRAVMGLIVERQLPRALILEDDFEFIYPDSQIMFRDMIGEVPLDWQMLYLGGHYAEPPIARVSRHVIRMGHMKTTSSYAVTLEMAKRIYNHIPDGCGSPIDELYRCFHQDPELGCYIFQPRLCVQYANFSDLQQRDCGHSGCMMDTRHENMV